MPLCAPPPNKHDFARGVLTALELLAVHDAETIYDELVNLVGIDEILAACEPGDRKYFSLIRYGWAGPNAHKRRERL